MKLFTRDAIIEVFVNLEVVIAMVSYTSFASISLKKISAKIYKFLNREVKVTLIY